MPQSQPEWLIYVVIAHAVFCFSFLVAWRIERKAFKQADTERADWKRWCEEAETDLQNTRNVRDQWIKKAQDLTGEVEELKKQIANDANGKVGRDAKGRFTKKVQA